MNILQRMCNLLYYMETAFTRAMVHIYIFLEGYEGYVPSESNVSQYLRICIPRHIL